MVPTTIFCDGFYCLFVFQQGKHNLIDIKCTLLAVALSRIATTLFFGEYATLPIH